MPRKTKQPYSKPLSLYPLTPSEALSSLLNIPKDDAAKIRNKSAEKLRGWRKAKAK